MRIGFVGVGNMGRPMALNLAGAGFDVLLYDADRAGLAEFARERALPMADGLTAIGGRDVVITMLPTGAVVREVLLEVEGGAFLRAAKPGTIIIDMSSSEPEGTRALAAELAKRRIILIDAPVSGGVARAAAGSLAIMAGGDDLAALAKVQPVLEAMGARIFPTGGSGSGHAVKALNNFVAGATFAALAEALLAARRFGLDETILVDVMDASTGHSFFTEHVAKQQVLSGRYATGFSVGLLAKDMAIAAGMARELGLNAPMMELVEQRWAQARDTLGFARDNSAAILAWDESPGASDLESELQPAPSSSV